MPHYPTRPRLLLAVLIAGLALAAGACAGDQPKDLEEAAVAQSPGLSWTQVEVWTKAADGRERSFMIGRGFDPGFGYPEIFALTPVDDVGRQMEEPGDELGSSDQDNLVRDLESASRDCSGGNLGRECTVVSLGYQPCQGCDHYTVSWLAAIKADDGLVSDIVFYQLELADDTDAAGQLVYQALQDYLERGGRLIDPVRVETSFGSNGSQVEDIDRLSRQLTASSGRLGPRDLLDTEEFFVILEQLLG